MVRTLLPSPPSARVSDDAVRWRLIKRVPFMLRLREKSGSKDGARYTAAVLRERETHRWRAISLSCFKR
ncbi:hypothetical protein NHX12_012235, partial [Muraenolepis orangiensis]